MPPTKEDLLRGKLAKLEFLRRRGELKGKTGINSRRSSISQISKRVSPSPPPVAGSKKEHPKSNCRRRNKSWKKAAAVEGPSISIRYGTGQTDAKTCVSGKQPTNETSGMTSESAQIISALASALNLQGVPPVAGSKKKQPKNKYKRREKLNMTATGEGNAYATIPVRPLDGYSRACEDPITPRTAVTASHLKGQADPTAYVSSKQPKNETSGTTSEPAQTIPALKCASSIQGVPEALHNPAGDEEVNTAAWLHESGTIKLEPRWTSEPTQNIPALINTSSLQGVPEALHNPAGDEANAIDRVLHTDATKTKNVMKTREPWSVIHSLPLEDLDEFIANHEYGFRLKGENTPSKGRMRYYNCVKIKVRAKPQCSRQLLAFIPNISGAVTVSARERHSCHDAPAENIARSRMTTQQKELIDQLLGSGLPSKDVKTHLRLTNGNLAKSTLNHAVKTSKEKLFGNGNLSLVFVWALQGGGAYVIHEQLTPHLHTWLEPILRKANLVPKFDSGASLPSSICTSCFLKIDEFYEFTETVRQNQEQLTARAAQLSQVSIKEEPNEPTVDHEDLKEPLLIDQTADEASNEVDEARVLSFDSNQCIVQNQDETVQFKIEFEDTEVQSEGEPSAERADKVTEEDRLIKDFFTLKCQTCSAPFDNFSRLKLHTRVTHKTKLSFTCCNKELSRRYQLLDHIALHLNPSQFQCVTCDKTYQRKSDLANHRLRAHSGEEERPFKCDQCSSSFPKQYMLKFHLTKHIPAECDICQKVLSNSVALRNHKIQVHSDGNKHVCDVCGRELSSRPALYRHKMQLHEPANPGDRVACPVCRKWFANGDNLRSHMKSLHDDKQATCDVCNQVYPNRKSLQTHKMRVHVEGSHECDICGKKFKRKIILREHYAIHTGEKLYTCNLCGLAMNSSSNLYSHRKNKHAKEWAEAKKQAYANSPMEEDK